MLKKNLTTGTIYAGSVPYNPGLSPVRLLSGQLLHQDMATKKVSKARPGTRPCDEGYYRQGYAIVYFAPATLADTNRIALAEQAEILGGLDRDRIVEHIGKVKRLELPEDIAAAHPRLHVLLINNTKLMGLWEVEGPAQAEREAITDANNQEALEWEVERNLSLGAARSSLAALLGEVTLKGSSASYTQSAPRSGDPVIKRSQGSIELSLEQALKLIAMIPKKYS